MDDRIERRPSWLPWVMGSVMFVVVAMVAYSLGAHREAMVVGVEPTARAWEYHPFGGIWMLFVLFWVFGGLRWMMWGGYHRPWRYHRYGAPSWRDVERDDWEDWHRREHERMNARRSGASRSDTNQGPI